MRTTIHWIEIVSAAVLLTGCGSEEAAPVVAQPEAAAPLVELDSSDPAAKMAKAVSTAKTGAAVDLRYEILSKPAIGTPFDIEIALVSGAAAETMTVVIAGMPGLTITNEVLSPLADVKAGQVNSHKFTALADQPGIYYISVTTTTLLAGTTLARTFSIPVLLGDTQVAQKSTIEAPKDATGQAIEAMPAKEGP